MIVSLWFYKLTASRALRTSGRHPLKGPVKVLQGIAVRGSISNFLDLGQSFFSGAPATDASIIAPGG
jgi:hypothetical protein